MAKKKKPKLSDYDKGYQDALIFYRNKFRKREMERIQRYKKEIKYLKSNCDYSRRVKEGAMIKLNQIKSTLNSLVSNL